MNSNPRETPVETEEQARLRREREMCDEFDPRHGWGWDGDHADDLAGWDDGGDGDGD
ncbi:MAG: hypothetical protein U1F81_14060 [Verrucomicrobiaceae bacterium]